MLYDVVIAGAGPVGLFLSCELAQAGCSVLVLEQAGSADSPLKRLPFGLRGLNAPTLEALDRRGLLDAVAATQVLKPDKGAPPPGTAHWLAQPRALGGHFAGIPFALDDVDQARWSWRLPTPAGTQMAVELQALEAVFAECAAALGVRIERGRAVQAVDAHEAQVAVHTGSGRVHGRWLVGCDGARSTVRKQSGFLFAGTGPEFTGYTLLVELADGCVLTPGRQFTDHGCAISTRQACWRWPISMVAPAIARHWTGTPRKRCCGGCLAARQRSLHCTCHDMDRCCAPGDGLSQRTCDVGR